MCAVKLCGLVIMGIALIVIAPAVTTGQFQPGGKGKKGQGGAGAGNPFGGGGGQGGLQDPNVMFEYLAKGRTFFAISETRTLTIPLTQFAKEKGITNGQISCQQFLDFKDWQTKQAAPAPGQFGPGGFTPGGPGGFAGPGGFPTKGSKKGGFDMQPPGAAPLTQESLDQMAEAEFRKRDRNEDNRLTPDEMDGRLRFSFSQFDSNQDGMLDLQEYKLYYAASRQGNDGSSKNGNGGSADRIIDDGDLDLKPVVFRAGKMPTTGLPPWFKSLDTDFDGQVALYEWRKASKSMEEFTNWDLNLDGFITPEEAIKQQAIIARANPRGSAESLAMMGLDGTGDSTEGQRPGKNFNMGDFKGKKGDRPQGGFPGGFGGGGTGERPAFGSGFQGGAGGTTDGMTGKKKNGGKKGGGN